MPSEMAAVETNSDSLGCTKLARNCEGHNAKRMLIVMMTRRKRTILIKNIATPISVKPRNRNDAGTVFLQGIRFDNLSLDFHHLQYI